MVYDYAIIGGGIIGLSVGMELCKKHPDASIIILEKEEALSQHQTGNNSGVIHSGIYYPPGSLKSKLARQGNRQMKAFCKKHGITFEQCGKVIVATKESELPLLEDLYHRGLQNQLKVEKISLEELYEVEPHVNAIAAIRVPSTGIVDFSEVSAVFADYIVQGNGNIALGTEVMDIDDQEDYVNLVTNKGKVRSRFLINCSGLFSDKVTELAGIKTDMKIIPFRGEYYELNPDKRHLVHNLIYPVPNPDFPFLGVHFTRMADGRVLIGPNAVYSFKREGYQKWDFNWRDFIEGATYPGFLKLARSNMKEGLKEMYRSYSKRAFIKEVQRFIPEINEDDITSATSGVRAQALDSEGKLLDDFVIIRQEKAVHVCNAPSPAATASIEIGKEIVGAL
ncbi:L-2-hydroxyglutarate oxidase [Virgibacillus salexigens]|uniref:Hydroxyglutarate oxidase n=1 Tax=Virgibacillus kapii TaxID=1638645 RepID=A0ABQ2DQP3_9BACI|nr:L-2-hydroxyglutarate oxidase [Virgibacillus kapii]GGJ64858.1 hydroxyglutarate oxidase [Virgibacillus kapii]